MKKIFTILSILFICTSAIAQEAAKAPAKPKSSEADLMLTDKNWQILSVEEWGVVAKPPAEKSRKDMLNLRSDGKYNLMIFGEKRFGSWSKTGQYIHFTDDATKKKFSFKVLSVDAKTLKVDHYSDEDGHSIFEYEAK